MSEFMPHRDTSVAAMNNASQFRAAFSPIEIHNHLNNAYHSAGKYTHIPPEQLCWRMPAIFVPRKVRKNVSAEVIAESIVRRLEAARQLVDANRHILNHPRSTVISHGDGLTGESWPHEDLFVGISVAPEGRPEYLCARRYSFNPYEVACAMIDDFLGYIRSVMKSRVSGFTKLSQLHQKAKSYANSVYLVGTMFQSDPSRRA